jgi:hypothetical protein
MTEQDYENRFANYDSDELKAVKDTLSYLIDNFDALALYCAAINLIEVTNDELTEMDVND